MIMTKLCYYNEYNKIYYVICVIRYKCFGFDSVCKEKS